MTVMHMSLGVGKVDRTLVDAWTAWYPARDVCIVLSHQIEFNVSNDVRYMFLHVNLHAAQYCLGLQGLKCFDSSQMSDLPPSFARTVLRIQSTSLWGLVYK
jgi:hypothetical protein